MFRGPKSRHRGRSRIKRIYCVGGQGKAQTTLGKITCVTSTAQPKELIPLWQAEQSGEQWWTGQGLYAAADEMIRYRCGDWPGAPKAGSCIHARHKSPQTHGGRAKHRGSTDKNKSQPEP